MLLASKAPSKVSIASATLDFSRELNFWQVLSNEALNSMDLIRGALGAPSPLSSCDTLSPYSLGHCKAGQISLIPHPNKARPQPRGQKRCAPFQRYISRRHPSQCAEPIRLVLAE